MATRTKSPATGVASDKPAKPKKPSLPKIKIPKQCSQDSPWVLNLEPEHKTVVDPTAEYYVKINALEELPGYSTLVGFIYRITDRLTGKVYIGQKSLVHKTKKKASQKAKAAALALNPKSRIKVVRGTKQSDWLCYWGSNRTLQQEVADLGGKRFVREIIDLCCTKKYLAFAEVEQMFKHNVLRSENSYNDNVLGKFYRRDLLNCPEDAD